MIKNHRSIRYVLPVAVVLAAAAACTTSKPALSSGTPKSSAEGSAAAAPGSATAAAPTASVGSTPTSSASFGSKNAPKKDVISGLIAFNAELKLSGAQNLQTSFRSFPGVTSPKSSCANIGITGTPAGKGRAQQFSIPSPPQGNNVTIVAEVSPYHGPGTYQKASLGSSGPTIVVGNASYNLRAAGADMTMTVSANGSGDVSFSGAAAVKKGQPALSGQIRWTCITQS